jgi:hypothetical protein
VAGTILLLGLGKILSNRQSLFGQLVSNSTLNSEKELSPSNDAVPFYVSSMNSSFSLAGIFEGNYRVHANFIEVTVTKAIIYRRNNCPYKGRTNLTSIKVGLGSNTKYGWTIEGSQSIPVDRVMKPGDTYTLTKTRFFIPNQSVPELSKHWLIFQLDQIDIDSHQSIGYSYAHSERNIFQRF